jgi:hypothetical protein
MSEKIPNHITVETSDSFESNIDVFQVPKLHLRPELGKAALIDSVPGVARSQEVIPGTPVEGQQERGVVVLDEYKGGSLDTVPGTEQYADKQEAIATIARSENAFNNPNKMQG